ncbi:MAG: response regulator transcription factor [Bacteroidales bacterium]|nr:response regulator transcription factor [Bacteroidales bacterium]MBQ5574603.1 response regulator transcription factor [Bacteroidales bacterium]
MAKRILIVDDEPDICEILRFNLEMDDYEVFTAESADEAQQIVDCSMLREEPINLILLDVMMTPKSGFEWAQELKNDVRTSDIPIIFCTAKTMEKDLLQGFDIGSDDYICKPFSISEVKARIKAVLKRTFKTNETLPSPQNTNVIKYEGIVMELDRKECYVDGKLVILTKLEFELLSLLLSKPGQVLSRETILQTVWPSNTIVLDRTVDVNITRIRKKIGRYGEYLRTKFGYGYMFGK